MLAINESILLYNNLLREFILKLLNFNKNYQKCVKNFPIIFCLCEFDCIKFRKKILRQK